MSGLRFIVALGPGPSLGRKSAERRTQMHDLAAEKRRGDYAGPANSPGHPAYNHKPTTASRVASSVAARTQPDPA
jgi:hypothetical protein